MRTKASPPKPREFKSSTLQARGVCLEHDGERIVDTRIDLFDGRESAAELKRYSQWIAKAARWAKGDAR